MSKKGGYFYPKNKCRDFERELQQKKAELENLAKLEEEWKVSTDKRMDDLQAIIDEQASTISRLTAEVSESETRRLTELAQQERIINELCEALGPVRRWLWDLKHASK